jgi:hypothetical protein
MQRYILLICFIFFGLLTPALAQEGGAPQGTSGTENKSTPLSKSAKRKKAKKEWKEHRKLEMEEKKAIKEHHKRIQTKETRKKMKQSKRKSIRVNEHKREFFLKRWFKRKKR